MESSTTDTQAFYQFLGSTPAAGGKVPSPEKLLHEWREQRQLEHSCVAIQAALDAMDAGLGTTIEEVEARLRKKHSIAE